MGGRKIHEFITMAWRQNIDIVNDPLLSAIVGCLSAEQFQQLKLQSRIIIDDAANLIGVVDTTGTLGPGEVFIKIKRNNFPLQKQQCEDFALTQIVEDLLTPHSNQQDSGNFEIKLEE